jgi:two-component system alkaline phosphatase synthesis response regulator PhoP
MATILVIEDDLKILRGLEMNLKFEGHTVLSATDGHEGLKKALEEQADLLLLDLMLPGLSGYDICRKVRERKPGLPIVMLTAKGQEIDKVAGLDLGADDYVTKPFGVSELMARIRALLRRCEAREKGLTQYSFGNVTLDFKKYQAEVGGKAVGLTAREFDLLRYLIERAGEAVHRSDLLDKVWGYNVTPTTRTVDSFVLDLRRKLEADPSHPEHILSVRGVGYKFVP